MMEPEAMKDRFFSRDEYFMRMALREAERALEHDDVPIGAVVVRGGEVIAAGHNERELRQDPTAHAEILALREAARAVEGWRVLDSVLYVTLEPCAMCAGAIVLARVPRLVYGTVDPKAGACGSVLDVTAQPRLNHRPEGARGPPPPGGRAPGPGPAPPGRAPASPPGPRSRAASCARSAPRSSPRSSPPAASLRGRPGGVPEWLNGAVSKTVGRASGSRVRISPPPLARRQSRRPNPGGGVAFMDTMAAGATPQPARILEDPTGRRRARMRRLGRAVATLLVVWLVALLLGGLGLVPVGGLPLQGTLKPGVAPPAMPRTPAAPAPA